VIPSNVQPFLVGAPAANDRGAEVVARRRDDGCICAVCAACAIEADVCGILEVWGCEGGVREHKG